MNGQRRFAGWCVLAQIVKFGFLFKSWVLGLGFQPKLNVAGRRDNKKEFELNLNRVDNEDEDEDEEGKKSQSTWAPPVDKFNGWDEMRERQGK
ncbi:hypothetical protein UVI_02020360 [Ustilaginoidea virens]|uniref:Uncharacterized protein n=1 Tax=Ustilaginoidea virens TaxID=1159556 RepID=A0A1B5KWX6_USTVR|nr:hypothetical protein UVI_02020360 [Ustilaginoidea virens]